MRVCVCVCMYACGVRVCGVHVCGVRVCVCLLVCDMCQDVAALPGE